MNAIYEVDLMKKSRFLAMLVTICLVVQGVAGYVDATSANLNTPGDAVLQQGGSVTCTTSVTSGSHSLDAGQALLGTGKVLKTAGAAMLYEVNSDSMVYSWNADVKLEPASLVKVMTSLLAIEKGNMEDQITITANAIASLPSTMKPEFKVGEIVTLEQMLYCMMVGSSNEAALIIAHHIAGSQQGFRVLMNRRAQELGCTNTNFVNAHGLQDAEQYSTARDMIKILREAVKHDIFNKVFSEIKYTIPATNLHDEARYYRTTNYMMTDETQIYYDRRVTGGRTGVTNDRRRSLIVTAESKGLYYLAVVMDAIPTFDANGYTPVRFGSYEEIKDLLNLGFQGYKITQVLSENDILDQFPVTNGDSQVVIGPVSSVSAVLPEDLKMNQLTFKYQFPISPFTAPVVTGPLNNTVQVWYKNICVAEAPVIIKNNVREFSQKVEAVYADENRAVNTALAVVGVLLAAALIAAAYFYLWPTIRRKMYRNQNRRRRSERRRNR